MFNNTFKSKLVTILWMGLYWGIEYFVWRVNSMNLHLGIHSCSCVTQCGIRQSRFISTGSSNFQLNVSQSRCFVHKKLQQIWYKNTNFTHLRDKNEFIYLALGVPWKFAKIVSHIEWRHLVHKNHTNSFIARLTRQNSSYNQHFVCLCRCTFR